MKNNNKVDTKFYEPNMKHVETDISKSISDRLDKMESMLLYSINKMDEIDRKLDGILNKNHTKDNGERTWYDELKSKI